MSFWNINSNRSGGLGLILLVIVFVLLSLWFSSRKALWRDESFSVLMSQLPVGLIIESSKADYSPPLYYLGLHYLLPYIETSDVSIRLFSLVFSLATIFVVTAIARRLGLGKHWSVLMIYILVVVNPIIFYFSAELRFYSLMMMMVSLMVHALIYMYDRFDLYRLSQFVLSGILLLYIHNLAFVWVVSLLLSASVISLFQRNIQLFKQIAIGGLAIILTYWPWLSIVIEQASELDASFWITFDPVKSFLSLHGYFLVNESGMMIPFIHWSFVVFALVLLFVGAMSHLSYVWSDVLWTFGIKRNRLQKTGDRELLSNSYVIVILFFSLMINAVLLYAYSAFVTPVLYERYVSYLIPIVLLLVLYGFINILSRSKIAFGVMFSLYLILAGVNIGQFIAYPMKTNYSRIKIIDSDVIYTNEVLDITSCIYYANCKYVGDPSKMTRFVGPSQLPDIPSIDNWSSIEIDGLIAVLHRSEISDDILQHVGQNFVEYKKHDLGDNVILTEFVSRGTTL